MDYGKYRYSRKEIVFYTFMCMGIVLVVSYLFYDSWFGVLLFVPFLPLFFKFQKKRLIRKRREQLNIQFKSAAEAISAALQAGYSVENGITQAASDLARVYEENEPILKELRSMEKQLNLNQTMEELWQDFAVRSGLEDIESFAEVFSAAKRTGGDICGIMQNTARNISGKIETREEIAASLAGKRMEQKVMSIIPMGIICYVRWSSGGFLEVLYGNVTGSAIMTICLGIYLAAFWIAQKIVDIEI